MFPRPGNVALSRFISARKSIIINVDNLFQKAAKKISNFETNEGGGGEFDHTRYLLGYPILMKLCMMIVDPILNTSGRLDVKSDVIMKFIS